MLKFSSGVFGFYTRSPTRSRSPRCSIQQATITLRCTIASASCPMPSLSNSVETTFRHSTTLHAQHAWHRSETEVLSTRTFGCMESPIYEWRMHRCFRLLLLDIRYATGAIIVYSILIYSAYDRPHPAMRLARRLQTLSRTILVADARARTCTKG